MKIIQLGSTPFAEAVLEASAVLERGGIVLYPTDTLYGLAVDAHNPVALSRLRALKGRETKKPISVIVPSVEAIGRYAVYDEVANTLASRHMPGALTLVLPAHTHTPKEVQLFGTIGVRVPDNEFCLLLAQTFGRAYTATSANLSGYAVAITTDQILQDFGPAMRDIDLVVDGGELASGQGSTVVAVRDGQMLVLREGKLTREQLGI